MSTVPSSRPPSLADMLDRVLEDASLSATRRRDTASALRTVGKALGRDLKDIVADPRVLRLKLADVSPVQIGLSSARWANVRSLVSRALLDAGIVALPGRRATPLTEQWAYLYDALPTETLRNAVSRFLGFCSAAGINADAVDDGVMDRYLHDLTQSLIKDPRRVHQVTCRHWNLAGERVQAWPRHTVKIPVYRDAYGLPWTAFPNTLREDTERWLAVLSRSDLLAEGGPARPLRPLTIKTRREQVRWFASALVRRGRTPGSLCTLADLVEMQAAKDGLRYLLERHGGKPTRHIQNMASFLRAAAQWAGADAAHLAEITDLCRRLSPGSRGLTQKNRRTLRQFDDPRNVDALLALPRRLVARAERRGGTESLYAAIDVQVAIAVELLLVAPVRIGNLAAVRLGFNLVRVGRDGPQHLIFPAADVKNDADLEFPLPEETTRLLDVYCNQYRRRTAPDPGDWLFPSKGGSHKRPAALSAQISARVYATTGLRLTAHQFRHIGAKLFLDANPGGYEIVRRVLGHRNGDTTTAFYTGLESAAALRHFDEQILQRRAPAAATNRAARPRPAVQERRASR